MRLPVRRLLAVMAAAIVCLTSLTFATAAHADGAFAVGYTSIGSTQPDDPETVPDVGRARNEVVIPTPDVGRLRNEVVVPEPDLGRARNEVVVPETVQPVPVEPEDTGISTDTWGVIGMTIVAVATIAAAVTMTVGHRHHGGHVAHPA